MSNHYSLECSHGNVFLVFTILNLFFVVQSSTVQSQQTAKMEISSNELDNNSSATSFSVDFDDQPKKSKRKPPKHFLERHGKKKEVSQKSIDEKQRQAEDRRKVN